jgi:type I restriction enzyme S subunit
MDDELEMEVVKNENLGLEGVTDEVSQKEDSDTGTAVEKDFDTSPEDWEVYKLRTLLAYEVAGTWGDDPENREGKPVLRATNFAPNFIDLDDVAFRKLPESHRNSKQLEKGDIILERSGGSADQPVGRVLFFDLDGEYYPGNFLRLMRPDRDIINRMYLYYFLEYRYRRGDTVPVQTNSTNIRNLQYTSYLTLNVQVPPFYEQRKIASVLHTVDELLLLSPSVELRKMKEGIMQDLLTGQVRTADKAIDVLDEVVAHG